MTTNPSHLPVADTATGARYTGVAILLHSSDDEELLAVADRVLVFNGGQVMGELSGEQRTRFALYQAAYASKHPA